MTSTVSNNIAVPDRKKRYSPVLHYWKSNVKSNIRMMVILTVLHFAAAPLVLLALIIGMYTSSYDTEVYAETFAYFGAITTAAAGFMGLFIAVGSFNCLHKRSVVDMKMSLPLTASQRFISDYLSGLFVYLAPFFAVQVISLLLGGYGLAFMEGKTFNRILVGTQTTSDSTFVCKYFSEAMPALLKLIAGGTLVMLMLYTVTVLVTVCCGSSFEAIAYTILINAAVPGTIALTLYNVLVGLYGLEMNYSSLNLITVTSPAGGLIYLSEWLEGVSAFSGVFHPGLWAALFLLMTAVYGAVSFFLYRKRRAEQVSKPFVFKLAYYIIITAVIFCIYSLYYINDINMVSMVVVTFVSYMIFEVVTNRGFRRFWLSIIKYIVTVCAAVAIVIAGNNSDGFGAVQRVPSLSSVSSVSLSYDGFYGDFYTIDPEFKDPENIQIIIDAHKAILKNYSEHKQEYRNGSWRLYENSMTSSNHIEIGYKLKNGNSLERSYSFLNWEAAEILGKLDLTNEYKTQVAGHYKNEILKVSEKIGDELTKYSIMEYYSDTNCWVYSDTLLPIGGEYVSPAVLYRKGFFEQLAEAYSNDVLAVTEENYYHSHLKNSYRLYLSSLESGMLNLRVPGSFTNTIDVMDRFGFNLTRVEDVDDEEIYKALVSAMSISSFNLFDEEQWRNEKNVPDGQILRSRYGTGSLRFGDGADERNIYLYTVDSSLIDILRAAEPRNVVENGEYVICVSGNAAVIPAEYAAEAELAAGKRGYRSPVTEKEYQKMLVEEDYSYFE